MNVPALSTEIKLVDWVDLSAHHARLSALKLADGRINVILQGLTPDSPDWRWAQETQGFVPSRSNTFLYREGRSIQLGQFLTHFPRAQRVKLPPNQITRVAKAPTPDVASDARPIVVQGPIPSPVPEPEDLLNLPDGTDIAALSTDKKILRAKQSLKRIFEAGHPVCVAWSGGKDSTITLSLTLAAAMEFREEGGEMPYILITHANTGIENPAYQTVIDSERSRIEAFIERHNLPARIDVATPALNDTWAVSVLSGRVLPTFPRSSTRQCSVNFKVTPQERQRKAALAELRESGDPVVLVGTRFDESTSRAERMQERGESDVELRKLELVDAESKKAKRAEYQLSPIAWWADEDVWVYLADVRSGKLATYTDVRDLWDAYAAGGGGGTCAVVGDESMKVNAKACGARFGCALCTAVGRDKSLESMIEADPAYTYLKNLNRLQRYLVHTQGDHSLRNWLGRSIDKDGFINIEPDTYSSEMLRTLLRICLSIQEDEREAAEELGIRPRFELVSNEQLLAIDAIWSLQARFERPFEAIAIWDEVVRQGARYYPPEVPDDAQPVIEPMPARRYLHVGDWIDDPEGVLDHDLGPMFDPVAFAAGVGEEKERALESLRLQIKARREAGETISKKDEKAMYDAVEAQEHGCIGHRRLSNGSLIIDVPTTKMFSIDPEGADLFMTFEVDRALEQHAAARPSPTQAFRTYSQYGLLGTSAKHAVTIDEMMRRAEWKIRHGLHVMPTHELVAHSISKTERAAGQLAPAGQKTLREIYQESGEYQRAKRYAEILNRPRTSSGPGF